MTSSTILSVLCQWLNSIGYKAIQAPSDNPAPSGRYISVAMGGTRQHGDMMVPPPVSGDGKNYKSIMQVAQVQLYEVEGDGEWLRDIRNRMDTDELDEFVKEKLPTGDDGLDNGFSVWDVGEIADNSTQDGGFWIRQRTMTFDVQFMDYIAVTSTTAPRMMSVTGKLNNEPFKAEVNSNG